MKIEWGENNETIRLIPENEQEVELLRQSWQPEVEMYFDHHEDTPYLEIQVQTS